MTQPIEFFYDFRSPYSYMAYTQLRDAGFRWSADDDEPGRGLDDWIDG